jgi:molecular chaperone IbpA
MTKITAFDLQPFYRTSIGVDRLFDRIMNQIDHAAANNYPPYNIIKTGENTLELQLAVAGFTQGEIDIVIKDGSVIVTGEQVESELPEGQMYVHRGISARKFVRSWPLGQHIEVIGAVVKDGILTIQFEEKVPEEAKPKSIAITYVS